jgi:hypothetical protein
MTIKFRLIFILLLFVFNGLDLNAQLSQVMPSAKTSLPRPENALLETARPETARPGVWMTYYNGRDLKEDLVDMKNHGVDAVEVGIWGIEGNSRAKEVLKAARETDMQLIIGIPEVSEEAFNFPEDKVERAVMLGGAYKGKAIDRFRFGFTPEKHTITIESPVYDSTNCYGTIGRYFMGLTPVKAEVIVKQADFDGRQHLKIIEAEITSQKEHFWNMSFDLTGVTGDLDNVLLAAYWTAKGTRDYWIFGDVVSLFSEGFKNQLEKEIRAVVNSWKAANKGMFPEEIIAVRYGDECFHLSGHLNSEACSFPVWDYSESAVKKFEETFDGEIPRGVGFTDMFGHEAYARWMYNFHEAAAQSVKFVKKCLTNEGVGYLPVFRNTTRMNIFDVLNDDDGSGQELLSEAFDMIHLDPYPVNSNGYDERTIPRDMTYMEGFSRRFGKPMVPWMQAHVYGHLQHPSPEHISKMIEQQKQFPVQSIIWLGYGCEKSGNTFPVNNPASWKKAKEEHTKFKAHNIQNNKADFAVIRPYTARSVRGTDHLTADRFLTDYLLESAVFDFNLKYDAYEPFDCSEIQPEEMNKYPFIIAELGIISEKTLRPFLDCKKPCLLIIAGAEAEAEDTILHNIGILKIISANKSGENKNRKKIVLMNSVSGIELDDEVRILRHKNNYPTAWAKDNLIVILKLPEENPIEFAEEMLERLVSKPTY